MRSLISMTLLLIGFVLQTAMAAQVSAIAAVRILQPASISLEQAKSYNSADQTRKANAINDITISASRSYHYVVSYNHQDTCRLIETNSPTISKPCSTATVNFN